MSEKLASLKKEEDDNLKRFSRSYSHQMIVTGVALLLISAIFFKEMADADLIVLDKEDHLKI